MGREHARVGDLVPAAGAQLRLTAADPLQPARPRPARVRAGRRIVSAVAVSEGRPRREMSRPILGMVLFVASEAMFFAAFFGAYFTIRAASTVWPPKGIPHLKIDVATALTVILVSSSVVL